ncbi:MAG: PHP domain-containing protein [Limisphaerales bacterium]
MFADLHLHSTFSDGTFAPEEIVGHGRRLGFAVLALTDHDTLEGCPRMAAACAAAGIECVLGAELTAELGEHELHILGYGLDPENQRLKEALARFQVVRQNRIREMVARLNELGLPLDGDSVFAQANCRAPGRPHVARALVAAGHCGSLDEAFERFLKKHRPAWVPKARMSAREAMELIHAAGGVAVLAHPGLNQCDEVIPELVRAGLDGIECYHTKHGAGTAARYLNFARQYGLLVTGGSDCHGRNKGRPLIGGVKLAGHYVHKLQKAIARRHAGVAVSTAVAPTAEAMKC